MITNKKPNTYTKSSQHRINVMQMFCVCWEGPTCTCGKIGITMSAEDEQSTTLVNLAM